MTDKEIAAVFEDKNLALEAKDYFTMRGFNEDRVIIASRQVVKIPESATPPNNEGITNKISNFFGSIFGASNHDEIQPVLRGSILTIHPQNESEWIKANKIMDYFGVADANGDIKELCTGQSAIEME